MRFLFLCLAFALGSCSVSKPPLAKPARPSAIVIVHGLFANAKHVSPLKEGLQKQGFICYTPNLEPNDGSLPIEVLARQLDSFISKTVPPDTPLQLIGHSMGGLVALEYLQDPRHASRCRALHTIATPHKGTLLAAFHRGPAGRQMTSNSEYLQQLHAQQPPFPVFTYRSSNDLVILPNSSSILPFAENRRIESASHNEILRSPQLLGYLLLQIQDQERL